MREIDRYKHNYKLDKTDIADIMTSYLLDKSKDNRQLICNKYNISEKRLYQITKDKKNNDLLVESINKNRKNFTKKCDAIINKALDRLYKDIQNGDTTIDISKLSTTLGILYDKSRLEEGLSTENKAVSINIKIDN